MTLSTTRAEQRKVNQQHPEPLVSIGIPTYNRAPLLRRAIESVLGQDYDNIELVVSDNASSDSTRELCEEFCRRDSRVRYHRQPVNQGLTANFTEVLRRSSGEFFMTISDDDWLDRNYVSQCIRMLLEQPDVALVSGWVRVFEGQRQLPDAETASFGLSGPVQLMQQSNAMRVVEFYRQVSLNYLCFGITRRDVRAMSPVSNAVGGDMMSVAAIAYLGKTQTLESTAINYSRGGVSRDWETIAQAFGLSSFAIQNPRLNFLMSALKDILWGSPVYQTSNLIERLSLSYRVAVIIYDRWARIDVYRNKLTRPFMRLLHKVRRMIGKVIRISATLCSI